VTKALQAVVDSTSATGVSVQTCLSRILPPKNASKVERALKALKSPAKEDKALTLDSLFSLDELDPFPTRYLATFNTIYWYRMCKVVAGKSVSGLDSLV
jgi:hypothetical protein